VRIRRIQLTDFRRYRELDIDLAPGLTVVRGPNEAGKSTIQRAIELALTRRVTSAASDLDALRPWDGPDDARSVIRLEFEQDEDDRVTTGTVEKVFAGSRGTVDLRYDGETITDPARADQVLAELTGIPTEPVFRPRSAAPTAERAARRRDSSARSTS
jgi:recombinational DNA repair ATPase RecF